MVNLQWINFFHKAGLPKDKTRIYYHEHELITTTKPIMLTQTLLNALLLGGLLGLIGQGIRMIVGLKKAYE